MEFWQAIILGVVQALTEFLPVSSSGHLVVGNHLLGVGHHEDVVFELLVHLGTLGAVFVVYARSLLGMLRGCLAGLRRQAGERTREESEGLALLGWVLVGSLPTAAIGLVFREQLTGLFANPRAVAACFVVTAVVLLLTRWAPDGKRRAPRLGVWRALLIGVAQGCAIAPGISRSGTTIACALFLGVTRDEASRYSFLLSIPAICGASLFMLGEIGELSSARLLTGVVGALVAFLVGWVALKALLRVVNQGQLAWFAAYLLPLALATWLLTA